MKPTGWFAAAVFLLLVPFLTDGCGATDDSTPLAELVFRVDPTQLGETYRDSLSSVVLEAPQGWARAPDSLVQESRRAIVASPGWDPDFQPQLVAVFGEPDRGAMLLVSTFSTTVTDAGRQELLSLHRTNLGEQFPAAVVSENWFRHKDFDVLQFMATDARQVVIKLFVTRTGQMLAQLDFVASRKVYEQEVRSIESSIGSLRSGHPNQEGG